MVQKVMKNKDDLFKASKERMSLQEDYELEHIWKQGFPSSTDHDDAVKEATKEARQQGGMQGQVLRSEILQTPEHEANNEFLVCLTFGRQKTKE